MPRNVRNFYVEVDADGRQTTMGTGPQGKLGCMTATFYIRDKGSVRKAFTVSGHAYGTGELSLIVTDAEGKTVKRIDAQRDAKKGEA